MLLPAVLCSPPLPPLAAPDRTAPRNPTQTSQITCPQGGTGGGLLLPAALSKPQIRLKPNPVCSALPAGRELRELGLEPQVVFGGHCELTWLWGQFTAGSHQTRSDLALPGEGRQNRGRRAHGAVEFSASGSSPWQNPPDDFRQDVKVQGLRDQRAWALFWAHLCLGLGDR